METVADFIFGGSKITAGGDCSHEIKRRLLLGRKVMTNLDSVFKSIDITLSTKFHLVKAMVFPVIMYGCESFFESWMLKNWCFWTMVLEKTLDSPLDCKETNQSILKEISPECSLEGLMLRKTEGRRRNGMTEDERVEWHHWFDGHEFEQALGVGDGQGGLACC